MKLKLRKIEIDRNKKPENTPGQESLSTDKEKAGDVWKIETKDDVVICTPPDPNMLTPYVLLEQEQWYDPEIQFVRDYLKPGMNVVDVGAGFGVYALPLARKVGPEGKVYAFEPVQIMRKHLDISKVESGVTNLEVFDKALGSASGKRGLSEAKTPEMVVLESEGDEVQVVTFDNWWDFEGNPTLELVKIDVNGWELDVLRGAERFLSERSPIVVISTAEIGEKQNALIEYLGSRGYSFFDFIAGIGLLQPIEDWSQRDSYIQNIIVVKSDRVSDFKEKGWILNENVEVCEPEDGYWKKTLQALPWTESLFAEWEKNSELPEYKNYYRALDYICAAEAIPVNMNGGLSDELEAGLAEDSDASENLSRSDNSSTVPAKIIEQRKQRSKKAALMLASAQELISKYNTGDGGVSVAYTLVRILNTLGKRDQAVPIMQKLMQDTKMGQENLDVSLPFLLPLPATDKAPIRTDFNKWLMVRTVESWLQLKDLTGYLSAPTENKLRKVLDGNPEVELQEEVKPNQVLADDFLESFPKNIEKFNNYYSEAIDVINIKDIASYSYSDPTGVAVIMPCIDIQSGVKCAKQLLGRAGMKCKIVIAVDTLGWGFIKVLNETARKTVVRYVIYVAQDAFSGMNWLRMAYEDLEKTGKGLLVFNDGKWQGKIASFGMVRKEWVNSIYDGKILFPGYKSHCADDELTLIAINSKQHVYNPKIVLMEIDFKKNLHGGGNILDRKLLNNRIQSMSLNTNVTLETEFINPTFETIIELDNEESLKKYIHTKGVPNVFGSSIDCQKTYHEIPFKGYEEFVSHRSKSTNRLKAILGVLNVKGKKVLDIGCNLGFFGFSLAKHGAVCVGIDHDKSAIKIAKSLAKIYSQKNTQFYCGKVSMENIKYLDNIYNGFDILLLNSIFHWLQYDNGSIESVVRILRPVLKNVKFIIYEPSTSNQAFFPESSSDDNVRRFFELCGSYNYQTIYSEKANNVGQVRELIIGKVNIKSIVEKLIKLIKNKCNNFNKEGFKIISRNEGRVTFKYNDIFLKTTINEKSPYKQLIDNEIYINEYKLIDKNISPQMVYGGNVEGFSVVVMEWINGVSIDKYFKKIIQYQNEVEFWENFWEKTDEVISIVKGLHDIGVIHNDLKPQNIFIENNSVKLIDFEFSGPPRSAKTKNYYPFRPKTKNEELLLANLMGRVGGAYRSIYGPGTKENDIAMLNLFFSKLKKIAHSKYIECNSPIIVKKSS